MPLQNLDPTPGADKWNAQGYPKLNAAINKINEIDVIGGIIIYAGSSAPTNYLICDGSAISRTTYSVLFGIIGTTYGVGNGTTTFNIPDLRSRFLVGFNSGETDYNALGNIGGVKDIALTKANIPPHKHQYSKAGTPGNYGSGISGTNLTVSSTDDTEDGSNDGVGSGGVGGAGSAFENRPPYLTINFLIKAI